MRRLRFFALHMLTICACFIFMTCSDNTTEPGKRMEITFSPDSGPPGTIITILGIDPGSIDMDSLVVHIGGRVSPVVRAALGGTLTGIPLFLDETGAFDLPASPVDLEIFEGSTLIFKAAGAITIAEPPRAPGTVDGMVIELNSIAASFREIVNAMISLPGVQEQYALATIDALDSLIAGSGEYSLPGAYASLQGDATSMQVLDDVFANAGVLEVLRKRASLLESAAAGLSPGSSRRSLTPAALTVSDENLARMMQFYVILSAFAEDVVAESAAQIGVVAGLIGIGSQHPYVRVVSIVTNYLNFFMTKFAVGLFPADLTSIDLEFSDTTLERDVTTNSTITLHAANRPPGITVLDLTQQLLVLLGLTGTSSEIQGFKDILLGTFDYFLGLMSSTIQSYAQLHPELGLDPALFSLIPPITWTAVASDPDLLDCETFTPQLISAVENELEWRTSDTNKGEARVYVRPATSSDSYYFPNLLGYTYGAGAFGENMALSPPVSGFVGDALELQVDFPAAIDPLGTETLRIRAGYPQGDGTVDFTSGISIELGVIGGIAASLSGSTDVEGYFSTTVTHHNVDVDEIVISVSATGQDDTFGEMGVRSTVIRACRAVDMQVDVAYNGNLAWVITLTCNPPQQQSEFWVTWLNSYAAGLGNYLGTVDGNTIVTLCGMPQGHVGDLIIELSGTGLYDPPCNGTAIRTPAFLDTVTVSIPSP